MEDKQLEMFEDRINRAIGFIENLKAKEKTLEDEKEDIERKVEDLQEQLASKDQRIEELLESQVFLKNKIETVLGKLESLANFDTDIAEDNLDSTSDSTSPSVYGKTDNFGKKVEDTIRENDAEQSGEIYVEENIVDLKEDNEPEQDIDQQNTTIFTPPVDQSPLFDNTENDTTSADDASSEDDDFLRNSEQEHKPLSDNPFIEM